MHSYKSSSSIEDDSNQYEQLRPFLLVSKLLTKFKDYEEIKETILEHTVNKKIDWNSIIEKKGKGFFNKDNLAKFNKSLAEVNSFMKKNPKALNEIFEFFQDNWALAGSDSFDDLDTLKDSLEEETSCVKTTLEGFLSND